MMISEGLVKEKLGCSMWIVTDFHFHRC